MENQQQRTKSRNCQVPFFVEENIYCYTCFDTIVNKCIIAVQHTKKTKKDLLSNVLVDVVEKKNGRKKNKVNTTRLE